MKGFVSGIGYHESKRLYEKCGSSPHFMDDFMCLANRFNAVFNESFSKFANGIKVSNNCCFRNLFRIYLLTLKALKSVFLSVFCKRKTSA